MTNKSKILIFAGTSDGRLLVDKLSDLLEIHVSVATEYGAYLLEDYSDRVKVHEGRLDVIGMKELMEGACLVIDATHPYADKVTANIKDAALQTDTDYVRLLREEIASESKAIVRVDSTEAAIEYLNKRRGKILLTVGSKELPKYKKVKAWQDRIYARVLPMKNVIADCLDQGFQVNQLIGMQGPFSKEFNSALIDQLGIDVIVTKDGGRAGGIMEKVQAAEESNIKLLLVARPVEEEGLSIAEVEAYLIERFGRQVFSDKWLSKAQEAGSGHMDSDLKRFFPVFYDSRQLKVAVVGGGAIASRRIRNLLKFECNLRVIADRLSPEIQELAGKNDKLEIIKQVYSPALIEGMDMVLAATDRADLNREIVRSAAEFAKFYNSASNKEECNFYFPAIIVDGDLTIGMTAQGRDHKLVKKMRKIIEGALREER